MLCVKFCALLVLILVVNEASTAAGNTGNTETATWDDFKAKFGKKYKNQDEHEKRRKIVEDKLKKIKEHNRKADNGEVTYRKGLNEYADMTDDEVKTFLMGRIASGGVVNSKRDHQGFRRKKREAPAAFDWRDKGVVTAVKNQGACGSCYAFSTIGSLESQRAIKGIGTLEPLSEQQIVDCSGSYGNKGCGGGNEVNVFQYITNGGISNNRSYPYNAKVAQCQSDVSSVATCRGYERIPVGEAALKDAVATIGPIAVAIDASLIQSYAGGIFDEPTCTTSVTHAVLAVGYGTENGKDYWIVKNSWGTSFGEDGYIRMSRNNNNQCGIGNEGYYPLV